MSVKSKKCKIKVGGNNKGEFDARGELDSRDEVDDNEVSKKKNHQKLFKSKKTIISIIFGLFYS